ncbi:hypothetical protein HDU76_010063, partial [Blyttiomyces sp. JEL0837]
MHPHNPIEDPSGNLGNIYQYPKFPPSKTIDMQSLKSSTTATSRSRTTAALKSTKPTSLHPQYGEYLSSHEGMHPRGTTPDLTLMNQASGSRNGNGGGGKQGHGHGLNSRGSKSGSGLSENGGGGMHIGDRPSFRVGQYQRGPPSVAESIASESKLSEGTRNLFKSMMRSSKLTHIQQRALDQLIQQGQSLPASPKPGDTFRHDDSMGYSGRGTPERMQQGSANTAYARRMRLLMDRSEWYARPSIRTLDRILETDAFEEDSYRPPVVKNRQAEKLKLQRLMESNGDLNALTQHDDDYDHDGDDFEGGIGQNGEHSGKGSYGRKVGRRGKKNGPRRESEPLDEFNMLEEEIQERRQWMDDMIALGHGEKYKRQIQQEISE